MTDDGTNLTGTRERSAIRVLIGPDGGQLILKDEQERAELHTKSNVQKRTRQASACVQFHVADVQNIYAYVHSLVFKLQMFNI